MVIGSLRHESTGGVAHDQVCWLLTYKDDLVTGRATTPAKRKPGGPTTSTAATSAGTSVPETTSGHGRRLAALSGRRRGAMGSGNALDISPLSREVSRLTSTGRTPQCQPRRSRP